MKFTFVCLLFWCHRCHKVRVTKIFCFLCCFKKKGSVLNSETIYFSSSYVIVHRGIIVWSWLQFITVVQYFRCQFSWDRSIIKWAQLKSFVSCVVSKKQASVLNSETIYFSSSYVIVYRGIILRTWLQLEEWYNILDANCWDGSWDYGKWYPEWRGHITPPKWPAGLGPRL